MSDYGVKISKEGYGIDDGDNKLIFNSEYPLLKIMDSGSGSKSYTNGVGTITLKTHNLGYKPYFLVFTEYVNINTGDVVEQYKLCSWREYLGLQRWNGYHATTSDTALTLSVNTGVGVTKVLKYTWVLFYDPFS